MTSVPLERVRAQAEGLAAGLRQAWQSIDSDRVLAGRIIANGMDLATDTSIPGGRRLIALAADDDRQRADFQQRLIDAGITWFEVPKPASIDRRQHPNRDELKEIMDAAVADWKLRQAQARKLGFRRSDYLPRES